MLRILSFEYVVAPKLVVDADLETTNLDASAIS